MAIAVTREQRGCVLPAVCVVEGEFRRPRGNVKVSVHGGSFQLGEHRHSSPFPLAMGRERRDRSEEHTSELQSLMRISYAVFCLKKNNYNTMSKLACESVT